MTEPVLRSTILKFEKFTDPVPDPPPLLTSPLPDAFILK